MKTLTRLFLIGTALLGLSALQACNNCDEDNDSEGNGSKPSDELPICAPPHLTFPNTVTFSHFEQIDFRMWTAGAEVDTDSLNYLDFVRSMEHLPGLLPEYYDELHGYTFTEDSIFSILPDGRTKDYEYVIFGNTIYQHEEPRYPLIDSTGNRFFGLGTPCHLMLRQGFYQVVLYSEIVSEPGAHYWSLGPYLQKFSFVAGGLNIRRVEEVAVGDTLMIVNRYAHFR